MFEPAISDFPSRQFQPGPPPYLGLANQVSHVLTIIILTLWWLEYRMSNVSTLCVLHLSYALTLWRLEYHVSRVLTLRARLSHVSYINILMYHLPHALNYLVRHN